MNWIKSLGSSVWIGILGFLAAMAVYSAKRQSVNAKKWQNKSLDIKAGEVVKGVATAREASERAKIHNERSKEIRAKAEARLNQMGDKDVEISVLLDRWRSG